MTYRASADWDLQFSDADALAAVADTLTSATADPEAGPRAQILSALAEVSTIQDIGFDDGSGLHLTGWTGGDLDITRCETVMAALAGQATGTIDWSDEEGVHWRDRLTRDGRWEQYPGIVVYPDGRGHRPVHHPGARPDRQRPHPSGARPRPTHPVHPRSTGRRPPRGHAEGRRGGVRSSRDRAAV